MISLGYHIYINNGHGGPIDYSSPIDTAYEPSWVSPPLAPSSSYRWGVRAFFAGSGLEEKNLDASVQLVLDDDGRDVTWTPGPPIGLRAIPLAGGRLRCEWTAVVVDPRRSPTGFNVYARPGALTDYTTPTAVVPFLTDRAGSFAVELGPFAGGTTYAVGVRSFNAYGEEHNTTSIEVDADSSPPSSIGALNAATVARS
jgi:hypothetical protein